MQSACCSLACVTIPQRVTSSCFQGHAWGRIYLKRHCCTSPGTPAVHSRSSCNAHVPFASCALSFHQALCSSFPGSVSAADSAAVVGLCRPAEPGTAAAFEAALAQCTSASPHLKQLLQGLAQQAAAEVAAGQELRSAMASKGTGTGAMDSLEQALQSATGFVHLQVGHLVHAGAQRRVSHTATGAKE